MAVDCALMITSKGETLFQTRPGMRNNWSSQSFAELTLGLVVLCFDDHKCKATDVITIVTKTIPEKSGQLLPLLMFRGASPSQLWKKCLQERKIHKRPILRHSKSNQIKTFEQCIYFFMCFEFQLYTYFDH